MRWGSKLTQEGKEVRKGGLNAYYLLYIYPG